LIGHGTILNVSVPGCLIDTGLKLKVGHFIQMRLTLAPGQESLWIALAAVRWVQGSKAGIEFICMSEEDQVRLRAYVGFAKRRRTSTWSEPVMWTGISGV
jgi:hypothetical protein